MGFISTALRIAEKDLKTEFRRFYEILSILTFSVSSILVCSFAWGESVVTRPEIAAAALWVILFFASVLAFTTSFAREADRGTLSGLKTLPCSPLAILLGKIIYSIILLSFILFILLAFSMVFLNLTLTEKFTDFLIIFLLGVVDLSFAGSFISGLVMFSEGKTLLLSFLLFPVCMPVLIPAVLATENIINGASIGNIAPELKLLIAFIFVIISVTTLTFKFVLEE
jgi:heme exporter protein B